jgi:hypothetical protein
LDCVLAIIMLSFPHIAKHQFLKPPFSAHFMDSQSGLVSVCKIRKVIWSTCVWFCGAGLEHLVQWPDPVQCLDKLHID